MPVGAVYLIVFSLALSVTILVAPIAHKLSYRFDILSRPGGRRLEDKPMPKLGGVCLYAGFVIAITLAHFLPVLRLDPNESIRLIGLLVGGSFIFIIGIIDDIFELHYIPLTIAQIVAAVVAVLSQVFIEFFNNPLTGQQTEPWSPVVTVTLTIFWLVLMMNTVNFLDGLDGLAGGVAFIAGAMLFFNSAFRVEPAQTSVSLLPLALMGSALGFVLFNFYPARLYMGGSAMWLGYTLGALSIIGGAKMATILLVMGLPLMDLAWQAFNRLRRGRNPFIGDRGHLHFRLLDSRRYSHRQIVIGYYLFCAFFGALTLITDSQFFKFLAFGVMLVLVFAGLLVSERFSQGESSGSS